MKRGKRVAQEAVRQKTPSPELVAFHQFLESIPPPLRATAIRAQQCKPPCLLCGQGCHTIGVFVPSVPQAWGIPEKWEGACLYTLCVVCVALQDRQARVEAVLWLNRAPVMAPWN